MHICFLIRGFRGALMGFRLCMMDGGELAIFYDTHEAKGMDGWMDVFSAVRLD